MGCDMIVALGPATANGSAFFALNCHGLATQPKKMVLQPGKPHAVEEKILAQYLELPQSKQTFTTLGYQPDNCWGYQHGINEHQVAAGFCTWQSILECDRPGLLGTDLIRLVLERVCNARQGVELLTDLIGRHGQGRFRCATGSNTEDSIFLIADPKEAFVVEGAGKYYALQEIGQVRAVSDVGIIRQDWIRLCPGLSGVAIEKELWPEDGSKLNFVGCISANPTGQASALRRWGRATFLLEGQNGHIEPGFARQLLSDHYQETRFEVDPLSPTRTDPISLCRHDPAAGWPATQISLLTELTRSPDMIQPLWYAFGPPCLNVYFPILLVKQDPALADLAQFIDAHTQKLWQLSGRLGKHIGLDGDHWKLAQERKGWLQDRFEEETAEFLSDIRKSPLRPNGEMVRQVQLFMQRQAEQFEEMVQEIIHQTFTPADALAY